MKLLPIHSNFLKFFTHFQSSSYTTSDCDSNVRLVVEEDDNGKVRLERVKALLYKPWHRCFFIVWRVTYLHAVQMTEL